MYIHRYVLTYKTFGNIRSQGFAACELKSIEIFNLYTVMYILIIRLLNQKHFHLELTAVTFINLFILLE